MPALTNARDLAVPVQRVLNARSQWPDQIPAAREWMAGVGVHGLHRVGRWERSPSGLMYARCGAVSTLWLALSPLVAVGRGRCLHCEDADDAREAA